MTEDPDTYLAVLKAAYDYDPEPDADTEIPIKENQVLLLLEKVDDDWWKVKLKEDSDGSSGIVPAAYVEPQKHISIVKVQYDYDAQGSGELSVKEDEILFVYDKDDAWLLVHSQKPGGRVGFVPESYVEEINEGLEHEQESSASQPLSLSKIVIPLTPPPPSAPYADPKALVAATSNKAKADNIETWAVSDVDKKGKKKKGTLGIGNGAVFFASESDKTPVQKWQTEIIHSAHIEKSKHVIIEVGGTSPINLHYHAGSKDTAEAIVAKLKSSKEISSPPIEVPERPRSAAKSVHFDTSPAIIPPRDPSDDEEDEDMSDDPAENVDADSAVALYDFNADGEDELSIQEGESLIVLEREADDWWKVRNSHGSEGVVPASYVEFLNPSAASQRDNEEEEARKLAAAASRRSTEEAEAAKRNAQKEAAALRAKAAAAAAEVDRRRRNQERVAKEKDKQEQREREKQEHEAAQLLAQETAIDNPSSSPVRSSLSSRQANADSSSSRNSTDKRGAPPLNKTRVWHDRTGQFRVEAAFLGYSGGKLRLHKVNGVVIEVPSEKMSAEDLRYVEGLSNKRSSKAPTSAGRNSEDDEPLASRRLSLHSTNPTPKKGPNTDWFEFFLNAGCDLDDCTRYASSFERDKIDESILTDITESTMRSLGLREGDIIRVKKEINKRKPKDVAQDAESAGGASPVKRTTASPAPNLFAGPNGALKNNTQRRGRPQPSKSIPPTSVDITAIASASDQIQRTTTPSLLSPASPVQAPPRASSAALPVTHRFEDDAWTNRPSSTMPLTPTPVATARAPSAPPASVQPAPTVSAPPVPPVPTELSQPLPTIQQPQPTGKSLASTTENDVFEQLARLSQLRTQSPAVSPPAISSSVNNVHPIISPPPRSFTSGMGMGASPVPIGQLQTQPTGVQQQQSHITNGARGPFAPVPVNQALLQPLIPTTTGFNSFVSTRQTNIGSQTPLPSQSFLTAQPTGFMRPALSNPTVFQPSFQSSGLQPQPTGFQSQSQPTGFQLQLQPTGFQSQSQPTGFQSQSQPTGFQPQSQPTGFQLQSQPTGFQLQSQPTGFQSSGLRAQPTGFQPSGGITGSTFGPSPIPFQSNFGQVQSNPTGFNQGVNQSPFGNHMGVPPMPPLPSSNTTTNSTAPANIFAQMKAGTFAANNDSAPKSADTYNALRPNTLTTGWLTGPGNYGAM